MIADFFTNSLQGDLFVKFYEVIMGWKHVDTPHIVPPSTKECAGYVVRTGSNKKVIEYSVEIKGEETERKTLYADIVHG